MEIDPSKHYCEVINDVCKPSKGCTEWNKIGACRYRLSSDEFVELINNS